MRAHHVQRLLKLADFLDTLPREKFDFSVITCVDGLPLLDALKAGKKRCGTVACAVGWMPAVFPRAFKWTDCGAVLPRSSQADGMNLDAAGRFFGLDYADTVGLFSPEDSGLGYSATPKQVARHIRRFVTAKQRN